MASIKPSESSESAATYPPPTMLEPLDESTPPRPTLARELRRRVLHFAPSWFSVNMGTGIVGILLHNLPYQFKGLAEIATAVYVLNIVLFSCFLLASIARYILWPNVFWTMLYHPQQSLFLGTFAMGFATIVNLTVLIAVPAFGTKFAYLAWAMWWIDVALSLLIGLGVPFILFTQHDQEFSSINPVWLLPVVAPNVAAACGALVASVLPEAHARLTIIISYILWGSVPVAFMIMTLVFLRMAIYKVPPAGAIISLFLPVGACGQGAFGLVQLATVSRTLAESSGAWLAAPGSASLTPERAIAIADAVWGGSICIALVVWSLGLFWLIIAAWILLDMSRHQKIPFNMGWWGLTFPIGAHGTATVAFAKALDSSFLRVLGTIQSLAVVLLWLYIASMTVAKGWEGSIFVAPCLGSTGEAPKEAPKKKVY